MTSGEDGASQSRGRRNPSLYIIDVIKIKQKQLAEVLIALIVMLLWINTWIKRKKEGRNEINASQKAPKPNWLYSRKLTSLNADGVVSEHVMFSLINVHSNSLY